MNLGCGLNNASDDSLVSIRLMWISGESRSQERETSRPSSVIDGEENQQDTNSYA